MRKREAKIKISILAFFLVILSSFSSAQFTEDFSIEFEPQPTAFQGTVTQTQFRITNTGNIASGYQISIASSDAADWVRMAPLSFTLQPGQTQVVLTEYHVPIEAKEGKYRLQTVFTTSLGTSQVVEQGISVRVQPNVEMQTSSELPVIASCGTAEYGIIVLNTGTFQEEYVVSVSSNIAAISTLSESSLELASGKNRTVSLSITPDDCTFHGDEKFSVSAEAKSTKSKAALDLQLSVENTFIPRIDAPNFRVSTEPEAFNITITNTGTEEADYELNISGPAFISIETDEITLDAEESASVQVMSSPAEGDSQQKYDAEITALTNGVSYSAAFTVNLKNPTWIETHTLLFTLILLGAAAVIAVIVTAAIKWRAYTKTPEYEERKKQKQEEAARRKAEKENEHRLKENEKEKLKALIDKESAAAAKKAEKEIKSSNILVDKEKLKEGAARRKTGLWWLLDLLLVIIMLVLAYGFRNFLLANLLFSAVVAAAIILLAILFIFYRKSLGQKSTELSWYALKPKKDNKMETGWKNGLGKLILRVNEVVPHATVSISTSRKNPSFLPPEASVYQYISISGVPAESVDQTRMQFRIAKKWLEKNKISPGNARLMRADSESWKGIKTEKLNEDDKYFYFESSYQGMEDCFAITGKSSRRQEHAEPAGFGWWVLFALIVIASVSGAVFYLSDAGTQGDEIISADAKGIPDQLWKENTRHTIDLSTYFIDPDGDRLTYTYTPVENIVVTISGDTATLTPEKDFSGERKIEFTADDGRGGEVTSNKINLIVQDAPELTFFGRILQAIQIYSAYIAGGIVLLVVLITILEQRKKLVSD